MNLILLLSPLVFLPDLTDGKIKCWVSKKENPTEHKDPNEKFEESLYKKSKEECKYCAKSEVGNSDKKEYARGCLVSDELRKQLGYPEKDCSKPKRFRRQSLGGAVDSVAAVAGVKTIKCVCTEDLCNASSLIAPRFTGAAILLALIVLELVTRSF